MGQTGGDTAYFREDSDSFEEPRKRAIVECIAAFKVASNPMRGSEPRIHVASTELRHLNTFIGQVTSLLQEKAFHGLPGVKRGRERLDALHHLTIGPWRGVFLVRPDGSEVIGLVFSKHPHALEARLDEIVHRYRAASGAS